MFDYQRVNGEGVKENLQGISMHFRVNTFPLGLSNKWMGSRWKARKFLKKATSLVADMDIDVHNKLSTVL